MEYTISHPAALHYYDSSAEKKSLWSRFIKWATDEEEKHHIGWVGVELTSMAAIFFPVTMCIIFLNGFSFALIVATMIPFVMVVVINLAALSTRYTIPLFFLGILINFGVIITSFFIR